MRARAYPVFTAPRRRARRPLGLNWRLILALAANCLAWWVILKGLGAVL